MVFWVVILIFTVVAFEVLAYMKSKPPSKTGSMEMRNRVGHQYDDSGRVVNNPPKVINKKPLYATAALYLLFGLFSLSIVALLLIMLVV
ncbi:unnamed protein product [Strongylus vulgaris]|uniref:DUF3899 domain-containing protein n=1 Tax=Strongylus vulgaris TaxID=40348 RepID=A0A3P7KII0_STRVU|nr:unnamed protein product [Strongylus vulgaris]